MFQNDYRLPTDKYIFDLKKAASIVQTINKKVEQLSLINKELQSRDIVYEEYLNKIKLKKEELKNKKILLETKEKEIYSKFEELIDNNESLKSKLKELNKIEYLNQLEINHDDEISKILLHNVSILREKINYKLMEAEEKEKNVEERELKINQTFLKLTEEQKEEYHKLELEYMNKLDSQNFYNALDEMSQLKMKDILQKIKESNITTSKERTRSPSKGVLIKTNQANGENQPTPKTKIKEKHASNGIENLVGKISKKFKKKENIVLNGLNLSGEFKCRHVKTKSEIPKNFPEHSPNMKKTIIANRSGLDITMSDNDISFLQTSKLNNTFYLIKNKRLEQQMNISLDIDFDSVCGPRCCKKLKKNYEIQYYSALNKSEKFLEKCYSISMKKKKKLFNGFIESKIDDENDETKADLEMIKETKKKLEFSNLRNISIELLDKKEERVRVNKTRPLHEINEGVSKVVWNKSTNSPVKTTSNDHLRNNSKKLNESVISIGDCRINLDDNRINITENKIKRHARNISMNVSKSKLNDNTSIYKKSNDNLKQHIRKKSVMEINKHSTKEPKKNLNESINSVKNNNVDNSNSKLYENKLKTITEKTANDSKLSNDTKKNLSISTNVNEDYKIYSKLNETKKSLNNTKLLNESNNKSLNDSKISNARKGSKDIKDIYHTSKKSVNPTPNQVPIDNKRKMNNTTMKIPNKTRKIINEGKSSNNSSKSKERVMVLKKSKNSNENKIQNNKQKLLNDIKILNENELMKDTNVKKNSKRILNMSMEDDLENKINFENGNVLNNIKMSLKSFGALDDPKILPDHEQKHNEQKIEI